MLGDTWTGNELILFCDQDTIHAERGRVEMCHFIVAGPMIVII